MFTAGAGISTSTDPKAAASEAAGRALDQAGAGKADAALVFATTSYGESLPRLAAEASRALGTQAAGATAGGVLVGGEEHEGTPAVAVLALCGVHAWPFVLPDLRDDEASAGEEIAARLGRPPRESDLVVLFPDPYALAPAPLLDGLTAAVSPARIVGAGAMDGVAGTPLQWCGDETVTGGVSGLVIEGTSAPRVGVTQACTPVTDLLTVTRVDGNWILELDGRPALDVFRAVARGPLAEDLRRAAGFLFMALPQSEAPQGTGDYLVRNVVGFSEERNAIASAEPLASGSRLAFALREPNGARDDMKRMLTDLSDPPPAAALYFNCCARGSSLFGVSGLESAYLKESLGSVPLVGMFGAYEIGPVKGRTELLTYTGVLALLDGE